MLHFYKIIITLPLNPKVSLYLLSNFFVTIHQSIIDSIRDNWGTFCVRGVSRPILDFEFCIDTSNSPPVHCKQPVCGFHDS